MNLGLADIIIIVLIIVGIIGLGFYFFSSWAYKKMNVQQSMIDKMSQTMSIYVIDKKRDKVVNANFPKTVIEQIPKYMKYIKMNLVKAKVGSQIITFICDKQVYKALPIKKNIKVDIAGVYITNMKGMKNKSEIKKEYKKKKKK